MSEDTDKSVPQRVEDGDLIGLFHSWNAETNGFTEEESRRRLGAVRSLGRKAYSRILKTAMTISLALHKSRAAVYSEIGFLLLVRQASYRYGPVPIDHPVLLNMLSTPGDKTIIDFGCGVPIQSIQMAKRLIDNGTKTLLVLCDVPSIRKGFVSWICDGSNIPFEWIDASDDIPSLPRCDALIAMDFLEHMEDPMAYVRAFDSAIVDGGVFMGVLQVFMGGEDHVSPNLVGVRRFLMDNGYENTSKVTYVKRKGDGREH